MDLVRVFLVVSCFYVFYIKKKKQKSHELYAKNIVDRCAMAEFGI